jgi:uncharacterized repeat protein (TIGR01451 family)
VDSGYVGTSLSNTADVSSVTADPDVTNNSSTVAGPVSPGAHLTILKTHVGTPVAGTDLTYHVAVTNTGPSDSVGPITVTDPLPTGEAYVSAAGTGWSCSAAGQDVTCGLAAGLVANTTSPLIDLVVALDPALSPGPLSNTASVHSGGTPDPSPGGSSTDTGTLTGSADLSIVKSHTGAFTPGGTDSYTLQVSNAGPSDAAGPVTVTDPLPAGESYVGASGTGWTCNAAGSAVTCQLAAGLAAGTVAVPAAATPITLTVAIDGAAYPSVSNTAAATSPTPDPDTGNNSSTDVAQVAAVDDLTILKTHTGAALAGAELTYTLAVGNLGPTADPGPETVTDPLPAGETFVSATGTGWSCSDSGSTVTCLSAGGIPVGYAGSIALTVLLGQAAVPSVSNTATVTGTGTDLDPGNNTSTDGASVGPGSTLIITKTLDSASLVIGRSASYTISVANQGPSEAQGVAVADHMPAGLVPQTASGAGWSCQITGQDVSCVDGGSLAADTNASIVVVGHVVATSGTLANAAIVSTLTPLVGSSNTSAATPPMVVAPGDPAASGSVTPTPGLAWTGADIELLLGVGLLCVLAGTILLMSNRRRRGAP